MIKSIIEEKIVSFKKLEQKTFLTELSCLLYLYIIIKVPKMDFFHFGTKKFFYILESAKNTFKS